MSASVVMFAWTHCSRFRRSPTRFAALFGIGVLASACSGGQSTGTTGAFTTLGPTAGAESSGGAPDTDDTDADPPADPSSTGGTPPATTEPATGGDGESSAGDSTTTNSAGSSTTDVEPVRPQPRTGWWSHCVPGISCGDGLVCMIDDTETDGACTSQCTPAGDATSCAPSPGGTSTPTCLTVSASSICALDCSGGKTCPGGMLCISDADDTGPIEICI